MATLTGLLVAGGGGGGMGNTNSRGGAGGGAGGVVSTAITVNPSDVITVVIGTGGAAAVANTAKGSNGTDTTATGFTTAVGGGGGSSGNTSGNGSNGGCGGGAGDNGGAAGTGGTGSQGSAGGNNATSAGNGGGGGGGGGNTGAGGPATTTTGGAAGAGLSSSITGSPVTYATGGRGNFNAGAAQNGAANTGNGGEGGERFSGAGGIGGTGVAIFSYPTGTISATGGTISTSGLNTIHRFTASGSLVFGDPPPPTPTAERPGRLRPRTPAGPGRPTRSGRESDSVELAPRILSVSPNSSRRAGGATATLTGVYLRKNSNGSAPSVTIDGVAATSVVVVNSTTITFTIPVGASAGVVDVALSIDTYISTLAGAFTYFQETILSVTPTFGTIAGGTKVKLVGFNFDTATAYVVQFGGSPATDVAVFDSSTIIATTPNNAVGFVDVELLSPTLDVLATLKAGFQYTSLIRGEDIRRNPGVVISEALGAPPSTCSFRIDGNSNAPAGGEKIQIIDSEDEDRVLWAGTVQTIDQVYEGQTDQLAWDTRAVDFTWLANKKRPTGSWIQISASQVVKELIAQCCPGFTVNHVQTNLTKVTVLLDGSKDLVTVLNEIAGAIGGGHWYFDFQQDTHFFHIVPSSVVTGMPLIPPVDSSVGSFITLATGSAVPFLVSYPRGYYALRVQNIFADGTEGALGPWSNLVEFNGSLMFNITNIPLGPTVIGHATVKRRLWFHRLSAEPGDSIYTVRPFCEIGDNTTTAFQTGFGAIGATVSGVTAIDQGSSVPVIAPAVSIGPQWSQVPISASHSLYAFYPFTFRYTFILSDGTETVASPPTVFAGTGDPLVDTTYGWTCVVPVGGVGVTKRRLYLTSAGITRWLEISDNVTTVVTNSNNDLHPTALYTAVSFLLTAFTGAITGVAAPPLIANAPEGSNENHPAAPSAAPTAAISSYLNNDPFAWGANWFSFRYAYLYRDGSVSLASPGSAPIGHQYEDIGYMAVTMRVGITPGPNINTNNDCIARLVYTCVGLPAVQGFAESFPSTGPVIGYGSNNPNYLVKDPDWSNMIDRGFVVVPDNVTDHVQVCRTPLGKDGFYNAGSGDNQAYFTVDATGTGEITSAVGIGNEVCDGNEKPFFSNADASFEFAADPVPAWPNEDGPYLEDTNPPTIIDEDNVDLLHEDSGSQGFKVTTDQSQIRNRVFVIGSGSTLTQAYVSGTLKLYPSDVTNFALGGGKLRIEDPANGHTEFASYSTLQQKNGTPFIVLLTPLSYNYSPNSIVYNFYQADDIDSQKYMAKLELDSFGNPTDGIHEYTISDASLKTVWQLYMRAQAELELYSRPIVTITYATRDPNTRIGRTVEVDLVNPPCHGSFLIQQVNIDQVRDEGDQLAPRYTARASSVRYDLNDLLLKALGPKGTSSVSAGGIAISSSNSAVINAGVSTVQTLTVTVSDGTLKTLNPVIVALPALGNGVYHILGVIGYLTIPASPIGEPSSVGFNQAMTVNYAAPSNRVAIGSVTVVTGGISGTRYVTAVESGFNIQSSEELLNVGIELRFSGQLSAGFKSASGFKLCIHYTVLLVN